MCAKKIAGFGLEGNGDKLKASSSSARGEALFFAPMSAVQAERVEQCSKWRVTLFQRRQFGAVSVTGPRHF